MQLYCLTVQDNGEEKPSERVKIIGWTYSLVFIDRWYSRENSENRHEGNVYSGQADS